MQIRLETEDRYRCRDTRTKVKNRYMDKETRTEIRIETESGRQG